MIRLISLILQFLKKKGITRHISRMLYMIGIIPLIILTLVFILFYYKHKEDNYEEFQRHINLSLKNEITNHMENALREVKFVADHFSFNSQNTEILDYEMIRILHNSPRFDEISIFNKTGTELIRRSKSHSFNDFHSEQLTDKQITSIITFGYLISNPVYNINSKSSYIYLYYPINNEFGAMGFLKLGFDIEKFINFVSRYRINSNSDIYLVDNRGRLISYNETYHDLSDINIKNNEGIKHYLARKYGVSRYRGLSNKIVIGTVDNIDYVNIGLITEVPFHSLFDDLNLILYFAFSTLLITIILAFYIGIRFSQSQIINPILMLERETNEVAKGDFNRNIILNDNTELGQLAKSFNNMIRTLNSYALYISENERKYKAIFNQTYQLSIIVKPDGEITEINNATLDFIDSKEESLIGLNIGDTDLLGIGAQIKDFFNNAFEIARKFGIFFEEIYYKSNDNNDYYYELTIKPIYNDNREIKLFIIEAHNITDRVVATIQANRAKDGLEIKVEERTRELVEKNEELVEARDRADVANKAKSEFLANMSHEIRTPLNAIIGFTDILETQLYNTKHLTFLNGIKSSAKSLLRIINDILDLSKIEANKLHIEYIPMNLKKLCDEINQIFITKLIEKKLEFIIDIDARIPVSFYFDEIRLRQILINIIGNSVKFTTTGSITLKFIYLENENSDDKDLFDLFLEVKDTGIGIKEESKSLIFEAFQQQDGQSNKQFGGTGLGLTITKRLTEIMNGKIFLESKVNNGTIIQITFYDIKADKSDITHNINNILPQYHFNAEKVLIYDEDKAIQDLIKTFLESANLQVYLSDNETDFLNKITQFEPRLIVAGIYGSSIQKSTYYEALYSLSIKNAIPFIINYTSSNADFVNQLGKDFTDIIRKPINRVELLKIIAKHLDNQYTHHKINNENYQFNNTELLNILNSTLKKQWLIINELKSNDDILNFSLNLHDLGLEYENEELLEYSILLENSVRAFEIDNMYRLFNSFKTSFLDNQ